MKRLYIYILLLAFIVKPVYNLCFLTYYQLNTEYITETFCENKEKVELACNGKCHLAKQLQADTNPQEENSTSIIPIELFSLVFIEKSANLNLFKNQLHLNKNVNKRYLKGYTYTFNYECFKPPIA